MEQVEDKGPAYIKCVDDMSTAMSSETTVPMIADGETESLSVNISTKQAKLSQSTSNSQKLCDLKIVLFKINVGECVPLPGGVGFSIQYLPAAVNLFSKYHIPVTWKYTKRKSKRSSDAISCCVGCTNGDTCKKAKASGKKKYAKRKKLEAKTNQAAKGNQQSDSLRGRHDTSFSAKPSERVNTGPVSTTASSNAEATDQIALPVGVGSPEGGHLGHAFLPEVSSSSLQQGRLVHGLSSPGGIVSDSPQTPIQNASPGPCVSSDAASNHSKSSPSACVPRFPENSHQETASNDNMVHVVFSRENVLGQNLLPMMSPQSSSVQAYPGVMTQLIPNSPISPVPLANTAVPSLQQCHFPSSPATATDRAHPFIPSNFVNVAPQHPHVAALPVYAPAPFPFYLQQQGHRAANTLIPVAVDVATGLPVYPLQLAQSFKVPAQNNSRQAVTSSFIPGSVGSPFIGPPVANNVPSSSASSVCQVQQSAKEHTGSKSLHRPAATSSSKKNPSATQTVALLETVRASEESSALAAMSAGPPRDRHQPPESASPVNAAQEIDKSCHQMGTVLEEVIKRNNLRGDFTFLADYYRSLLEQDPTMAITVTGVQSLKHFLQIAQSKFSAEAYTLHKSCASFQSLTEKCQESIRVDGDRYQTVLNKKINIEKNVGFLAKRAKEQKRRNLKGMGTKVKELEAKIEALQNERDELQKKWEIHEQTRILAPCEEHPLP